MSEVDWQTTASQAGPVAFASAPDTNWTTLQPLLSIISPMPQEHVVHTSIGTSNDSREIIVDLRIDGLSVTRSVRSGEPSDLANPEVLSRTIEHLHNAADALNDILIAPFTAHLDALHTLRARAAGPSRRLSQFPRRAGHSTERSWRRDVIGTIKQDRERLLSEPDFGIESDVVPTELHAFARRFANVSRPYPIKWTASLGSSVFEFNLTLPDNTQDGLLAATVSEDARLFLEPRPMSRKAHPIAAAQLIAAARLIRLSSGANPTFVGKAFQDGESDTVAKVEITPEGWTEELGQVLRVPLRSGQAFEGQFVELVY
ncbi:MAG: hypothetical protein ABJF07_09730 [Nisaea sp.]|uniref:hypothetical protein n=1 Tax=Nisaea sp. TaxID=2024842 RepID=UPI003263B0EB